MSFIGLCVKAIVRYVTFIRHRTCNTQPIRLNYRQQVVNCALTERYFLLSRSRLCHYSVGGAWWHLGFYESF
jgi:hypothetical protein